MQSTSSSQRSSNLMVDSVMKGNTNTVLTIGHSTHAMELFLELLHRHGVTALADVRSVPYSRFNPQFDREQIVSSLKASNIKYVFLGRELGGRSDDRACYEQGRIRYDRLSHTSRVRDGLQRILKGAKSYRIALMCAEKEPLHCHRTLLIGHELDKLGTDVAHILSNGVLEPHEETMTRLLSECKLESRDDLFHQQKVRSEYIEEAIQYQSQRFGHTLDQTVETEGRDRR